MTKPDFIGVGVQKCATGWMFNVLDDHPSVVMGRSEDGKKNIHFFDHFYDRGYEWYEGHFPGNPGRLVGEFSTSYLCDANVPGRVHGYAPDVKLLVSLRHPVDRAVSNHKHQLARGRLTGSNVDFAIALDSNPMYLHQSRYALHISRWLEYFPKERFHIVLVEDIERRPARVAEALYAYLGIDDGYRPETLTQRIHASSGGAGAWSRAKRFLQRARAGGGVTHVPEPVLTAETRDRLLQYFREDTERLAEAFDLNLSEWLR